MPSPEPVMILQRIDSPISPTTEPPPYPIINISKTSKCLISLNLLEKKKKDAKCNNFQRNKKKNFKEILVLKILRLLIALKHSFKGFKKQKALFKPFDIFLMNSTTTETKPTVVSEPQPPVNPEEELHLKKDNGM